MRYGHWTFAANRKGGVLFPASERAEKIIREMPFNKSVLLEARTARNPEHHELFFTILDRVVEATGRFPNFDTLNKAMKFSLGITEEWLTLDGEVRIQPGSIAWSAMPQEQFKEYFERAQDIIAERFFPDMTREQIAEVQDLQAGELGRRAARGGRGEPDK